MQHDDIRGVGEILNETVCLPEGCKGLTVRLSSHPIFSRPSCRISAFKGKSSRACFKVELNRLFLASNTLRNFELCFADTREVLCTDRQTWRWSKMASNIWSRNLFSSSPSFHRTGCFKKSDIFTPIQFFMIVKLDKVFSLQEGDSWINSHKTTFSAFEPSYSLPKNVALLTLQVSWIVLCKYVKRLFFISL